MNFQYETAKTRERELKAYKEAFDYYDWNKSGTISIKVGFLKRYSKKNCFTSYIKLIAVYKSL